MRVLIAPDAFAGTLSAVEAADAIAEGWRRRAPGDELETCPMADGGPGFVDVLHASLGGELVGLTVPGPARETVPVTALVVGDTAYVESAQACGRHLLGDGDPERATTYGVGAVLGRLAEDGVRRIVVGLGGSGTTDGGAGLLGALGATADVPLDEGVVGLAGVGSVDTSAARDLLARVELVAATDVDHPLTGLFGTAKADGLHKGIAEDRLPLVDGLLDRFAAVVDRRLALEKGAGAAGGLGYALLHLGARRVPGFDVVADGVDLAGRARRADLVVTGEGAFDFSSRSGKVPYGVAAVAADALRPCIALAGQVLVGAREMRALGVESGYSVVELIGRERAFADPAGALADLAERVARTWSR